MNVLIIRYRLNCRLRVIKTKTDKNQYRIFIQTDSMNTLRGIVTPYMVLSMLYKLAPRLSSASQQFKSDNYLIS